MFKSLEKVNEFFLIALGICYFYALNYLIFVKTEYNSLGLWALGMVCVFKLVLSFFKYESFLLNFVTIVNGYILLKIFIFYSMRYLGLLSF